MVWRGVLTIKWTTVKDILGKDLLETPQQTLRENQQDGT